MRFRLGVVLAAIAGIVAITGCGSSNSSTSAAPGAAASSSTAASATSTSAGSSASANTSQCGPKPGVAATGTPIVLGAINTKQPGTDFTDISNMEAAYFACVNANGGVNGHPIKLQLQTEATQPPQIAAASGCSCKPIMCSECPAPRASSSARSTTRTGRSSATR